MSHCKVCGKPLTDPVSQSLGIGPICRVSQKQKSLSEVMDDMFGGPDYTVEHINGVIVVVDQNSGGMSVTNGAESVVREVMADEALHGKNIVYRDSMGVYDELLHDGDKFTGFRALNADTAEIAVRRVNDPDYGRVRA